MAQRTHEIGIRMALGATSAAIRKLVLRQGMQVVLLGSGLGLALSFLTNRLLAGFLFGVRQIDPATLISVALLMIVVGVLAVLPPIRRATLVDPAVTIRAQ